MNNVSLVGRLTINPELRYTSGTQMAVARFSIAIDRPRKSGEEKVTDFPNIVVFGKQAENCERFLHKGSRAGITGRIQTGKYQNKEGRTVYTTEVLANYVEFLDWNKDYGAEDRKHQETEPPAEKMPEGFSAVEESDIPF